MNVENGVSYGTANGNGSYGGDPEATGFFFNHNNPMMQHVMEQPPQPQQQQQHQQQQQQQQHQMMLHQQPQQQQQQQQHLQQQQQQQQHQQQQQQQQQHDQQLMGYPMSPSPNSMMRFGSGPIHEPLNGPAGISSPALARALSTLSADRNRRPRSEKKPIPDEQKDDKYFERRRRNNEAAKKSRDARKAREDELAIRASFLEKDNSILKVQVHSMREEAMKMRELWVAKCQGLAITRQQMQQQQQQQLPPPGVTMQQQQQQQQQQNAMQMTNGAGNPVRTNLMLSQPDGYS